MTKSEHDGKWAAMKTVVENASAPPSPLSEFVADYKSRRENKFDALPLDQQVVRLKETVGYLVRRCEAAESSLVVANTTIQNLHSIITELQADH